MVLVRTDGTTGRCAAGMCRDRPYSRSSGSGMRMPSSPTSLFTAAVAPLPTNSTTCSGPALTERATTRRASSRSCDIIRPVLDTAVWVLA